MVVYILKSSACLAIFLLFYKLLLEQESIHRFKRYFLLGAITISFVIPTVVFTDIVYTELPPSLNSYSADYSLEEFHIPIEPSIDYTYRIISFLYFIGVLFFSFKFFKNLIHLKKTIQQNPKYKINSIINVLLSSLIVPHTFFNYIFLNKQKYEANEIPIAVLIHEETHARQKHSIDILVMEILQIAFWFNPLIYLFKKSIKLNHEFLADNAVLNQGLEKSDYQNILLAFSSNATEPQLANAITYSSIKKRFTVMKKRTSKKSILLRSFLVLPLAVLLLFGFSERKLVENQKTNPIVNETAFLLEHIEIRIDGEGSLFLKDKKISNLQKLEEGLLNFNQNLSKEQREQKVSAVIKVAANTPKKLIEDVDRILVAYGVATIDILGPEPAYTGILIETVTKQSQTEKYNSLARKYNAIPIEKRVIPLQDLKVLETIYRKLNTTERQYAQPFPECLPKNKQDGATRQQMKEYDVLAKKYNNMLEKRGNIRILESDVDRLEYLYSLMSEKQRNDAEPFPDFPEPPPVPQAPESPNEREVASRMIKRIIEEQDPYDVGHNISLMKEPSLPQPPKQGFYLKDKEKLSKAEQAKMEQQEKLLQVEETKLKKQERSLEKQEQAMRLEEVKLRKQEEKAMEQEVEMREKEMNLLVPTPPAPPTPTSPLDYAIEMAKKGATFYYEGKKITSDKAIELLKKNRELNMESRRKNGNTLIKITKEPVTRN